MSITELVPAIQALSRAEKVRLLQVIAAEIAQDEGIMLTQDTSTHEVWSPHDAFDAAEQLLLVLKEDKEAKR